MFSKFNKILTDDQISLIKNRDRRKSYGQTDLVAYNSAHKKCKLYLTKPTRKIINIKRQYKVNHSKKCFITLRTLNDSRENYILLLWKGNRV